MSNLILVERRGHVAIVTLNDPSTRNAISDLAMIDAFVAAFEAIDRDTSVRAVVLTGAGSAFCSGGNLKKIGAPGGLGSGAPEITRLEYKHGIQRIPLLMQALDIPVIAAVNGPATGAGCDLACMCDVRIAAESARFAESFVKLGLIPGDGGAWLLPRIIGFSRATELALTGEQIDAATALEYGLVSRVVPDAQLMDAARALAMKIAANPPHAVRMTKRLLREAQVSTLPNILELSAAMQGLAHQTADHDEAIAAFVEKRAPAFRGD